jgi:general transcriptional corepressor TUP1
VRRLSVDLSYSFPHDSVVCCVNFSHDGQFLATGCDHRVHVYDVDSGARVHSFLEPESGAPPTKDELYIRSLSFSRDGHYLAVGAEDRTVKLFDWKTKSLAHTFDGHQSDIYSLVFSPDSRLIVSGSGDKHAKVWDIASKQVGLRNTSAPPRLCDG